MAASSIVCPACEARTRAEHWIVTDPLQPSQQACPSCKERFDVSQLPTVVPLNPV